MAPDKRNSTPSWLLPAPVRRFRDHLREIRRLVGETQSEMAATRHELLEMRTSLSAQVQQLQETTRDQRAELARIADRLDDRIAPSGPGSADRRITQTGARQRAIPRGALMFARGRVLLDALAERLFRRLDSLASRGSLRSLVRLGLRAANTLSPFKTYMPIVWLDKCLPAREFAPEGTGLAVGPNIDGHPVTEHIVLPPIRLYALTNVTINPNYSVFVSERGLIIDRIIGVDSDRCLFVVGHPMIEEGHHLAAITESMATPLEGGFFLSGAGYWNYYHWMIEILPKLRYWQSLSPKLRGLPLLIGEKVFQYASMLEALDLFCDGVPVQGLKDDALYTVRTLLHINAPSACVFNLRGEAEERVTDTVVRPEIVYDWRERAGLEERGGGGDGRRLFLARSLELRSYNQADVLELFVAEGFEVVRLDQMTLREQIDAMNSAAIVAGPIGAGWTNLIFCSRGAKALSWIPEASRGAAIYSTLASIVGVEMRYLTYPTDARSSEELYLAEYELDLGGVRRALAALLSEAAA